MKQYRHGDLLIEQINKLPKELKKQKTNTLLEGIATGHAHRAEGGDVYSDKDGNIFIKVNDTAILTHDEHSDVELENGYYKVIRQQEYDIYEGVRNVED